jgi:cellulose synthase/poly-beta-1,6-N-acetylglucosamine synthase-like glycosyltransferase
MERIVVDPLKIVLWGAFITLIYTYVGYPCILAVWRWWAGKPSRPGSSNFPTVSIVIAARNEGKRLAVRIDNCLRQHYPPELLNIIVVSDGSTDETEEIVRQCDPARVTLLALTEQQGKAMALTAGVARTQSEIIVFADARQVFSPSAVAELAGNFSDPQVGAVSGELMLQTQPTGIGAEAAGLYWSIEKWIRRSESAIDSAVGTTGAIYAIRRSLFEPLPQGTILDDLLVPMRIAMHGYRVVFEPRAQAFDWIEQDYHTEFKRKVRTLAGNYQALMLCPDLMKPWRNRLFFQFISHKVCRLAAPFCLVALFVSNLFVMHGWLRYLFILQAIGYTMAAIGWGLRRLGVRERWTAAAFMFVMLNAAALLAAFRAFRGHAALWDNPRETPEADDGVRREESADNEARLLRKVSRTSL